MERTYHTSHFVMRIATSSFELSSQGSRIVWKIGDFREKTRGNEPNLEKKGFGKERIGFPKKK